jgi:hypothetical protein
MDQYAEIIRSWQVFYATLATACATLIGLLFIAFTFNADIFRNRKTSWHLRIARKTFGDFLLVLMTSLMFLVPGLPPVGLASALLALGIAWSLGVVGRLIVATIRTGEHNFPAEIRVFGLSLAGGIGLMGVAVALWLGHTEVLYWLVAAMAALLASASTTAWTLLTANGKNETPRGDRTRVTRPAKRSRGSRNQA